MHCSRELFCLGIICLLVGGHHMAEAGGLYTNPFDLENEWTNYGIGDPYILRWNGRYYLYPSTNTHYGGSMGIRTWISQDLINWDYAGYATTEPVTKNAFAPEVVYWNGFFYMYTSPDGQGHYVLKSDRPTGPFTVQTDNLGLTIDGSVFIDDDGRWYFTHAGHLGIRGHRMADPYTVGPERVLNSSLGGWTEGSYILKRNDLYYLTYTGNHLLSTGYRVHYSMSEEGPLGPYIVPEDDLILISTKEGFSGLGHSATVLGPDLDSYYIVYHSMPIRFGPHLRKMNIDRLAFNGKRMMVLGPTNYPQKGPKLPEFYTWIDEDGLSPHWIETKSGDSTLLLSRSKTGPDYTAEFNFAVTDKTSEGYMGTLFSYIDDQNFACVLLDLQEKSLELQVTRQGQLMRLATAFLFEEVDLTRLHTLRVVKYGDRMEIYFDNMKQFALDLKGVFGGSIGYIYDRVEPLLSFTAFSSEAKGSSDYDVPKPIPGTIQGVHYRKDGYCVRQSVDDNPLRYRDGTRIHEGEDGTYSVELVDEGDWLSYNINVEEEDTYGVALTVPVDSEATVQIWVDDSPVLIGDVINKDVASKDGWVKVRVGTLELPKGLHTLKVQLVEGRLNLESFEFYPVMTEPFTASTGLGDDWQYYGELDWQSSERGYGITRPKEMMAITGEEGWTDYRVEVDLYVDGQIYPGEAGLVVRATHPSYFQGQVKDAVIGYYVAFNGRSISLKKLRYNSQTLAQVNTQDIVASRHHLAVEVVGSTIKVYWDGSQQPIIEYTDPNGLLHGAVGLRTNTPAIYFKDFALTCLSSLVYGQVQIGDHTLWISPTRQKYEVKLPFGVVDPPTVMVVPQDALLAEVKLDSNLTIEVRQPQKVPGEGRLSVLQEDGIEIYAAPIVLSKVTTPTVGVRLKDSEVLSQGWAGSFSGLMPIEIQVNGPDSLITGVSVTLARVELGEVGEGQVIYQGDATPKDLILDTPDYDDGTYELTSDVVSIYDTNTKITVRFAIKNWRELVDDLEAPKAGWFGMESRKKTIEETAGWVYATDTPELFFGDQNRLVRVDNTTESLIWDTPGLQEFFVTVYTKDDSCMDTIKVAVSVDGQQWVSVDYEVTDRIDSSVWTKIDLVGRVPSSLTANYFRLTFEESLGRVDALQLGRVGLRSLVRE